MDGKKFISLISFFTNRLKIDLNDDGDRFWYYVLALWAGLYVSDSLTMLIAAIIPYYLIGIAMSAASYGLWMVLNGYFVKKSNIPIGWKWMHYLSFEKYMFEGFVVNEFDNKSFPCDVVPLSGGGTSCYCLWPDLNNDCNLSGEEILTFYQYENVSKWEWFGIMWAFAGVLRIGFYLMLRFFNKGTR